MAAAGSPGRGFPCLAVYRWIWRHSMSRRSIRRRSRAGALIELLGDHYGVDDVAADAGTIGYEILTALGSRYHRIYREPAA